MGKPQAEWQVAVSVDLGGGGDASPKPRTFPVVLLTVWRFSTSKQTRFLYFVIVALRGRPAIRPALDSAESEELRNVVELFKNNIPLYLQ